ncbi:hypothetical protein PM082_003774 [Marasmius tenuissimus]|nr:hypothetical protein PM082_003774 [Marasmius tenuissimus]
MHAFGVTGYLDGTTPNPLVVGPNITTNSDLRIFASDGNVTMQSIASPDNFNKVCGELFERMIDTVPRGVQLTDVVEPIAYKVGDTRLFPGNDGLFRFTTDLRLLGSNPSPSRTVTLFWNDRQGSVCPASGCSVSSKGMFTSSSSSLALKRGLNGFSIYQFDAKINMTSSISKFWFEVDEGNGSEPVLVDNDGAGLPIKQDTILFDRARSSTSGLPTSLDLVVAVRTSDPSSTVSILSYESGTPNDTRPKRETIKLSQDSRFASVAGYMFFSTSFPRFMQWMDIEAEVGGERYHEANVNVAILRQ